MKIRSVVVAILLCITLFATTALSRAVVDTSKQQRDVASSGAQVQPDFFRFRPRPHLHGPWWWFIPPHRPGLAAAPHAAPHILPKWPWPHPPLPHFPTPKKPPGHSPASAGLEPNRANDIEAAATAAFEKCWSPLAAVDNCVYDILSAFTTGTVEFDSPCCSAINKMAADCVASFNNQEFTDALSNYCSTH